MRMTASWSGSKRTCRIQVCLWCEAAPQMASSPRINTSVVRRRSFNRTSPCHHRSACSGVKALRNTSAAKRQAAKLCYRFGPLTPSARFANLIAGDGTKNGLSGRVEDWRAGLGRSLGSLLARPFVCECPSISAMPRFQPPPHRTQHADFPHYAPPFASLQGLWDLSYWSNFRSGVSYSIAVEQPESVVQPRPTPLLPAEALSFPSMRQMAPDLSSRPNL